MLFICSHKLLVIPTNYLSITDITEDITEDIDITSHHRQMKFGDQQFANHLFAHAITHGPQSVKYEASVNEIVGKFQMNQPVVVRNGAAMLEMQNLVIPNIAPTDTNEDCFHKLIEALPGTQILNVISQNINNAKPRKMTVTEFASERLHPTLHPSLHPMNVLDIGLKDTKLSNELPRVMTEHLSFGHILMNESTLYEGILSEDFEDVDLVTKVSKFALLSEAFCQTNFHQDFSATSVMYILVHGQKIVFTISPTDNNCKLLDDWDKSKTKDNTFFGDHKEVDGGCIPIILHPGDVLFLPSNWIHAVLTPVDSVAIGTNFIFRQFMPQAIAAYSMERESKLDWNKCFPNFYVFLIVYLHWCFDNQVTPVFKNALETLESRTLENSINYYINRFAITSEKWETIRKWIQAVLQ